MAGIVGSLYGFNYYYSASFTDSFYTAFPQNEVTMNQYALQASNYFYLFVNQRSGTVPIYRYYATASGGDHYYTRSGSTPSGYISEGIVGYGWPSPGSNRIAIYRFYSPSVVDHRYLTSSSAGGDYIFEGIEWYSPVVVNGCSDPLASNYNPDVNQPSSGCTYSPPSVSFSASPTSIIIPASSTLSWNVTGIGISSVSIDQGIGSVATSGTRSVSPTTNTTYTITAIGIGGTTSRTATVTATLPPPPTVSFSISPSSICRGNTATLSWSVTGNVSSVSIDQGIGSVATLGTRTVGPLFTTTYTLTAIGIGGTTNRSDTLTVLQPSDVVLTLDSPTIIRGQSTTLRWTTTGDTNSASITPGIGAVNINGNTIISPTETATYEIYVDGVCVDDTASITLTVYQPPTVDLSGPESLNYEQQGTLTYQSTDADIILRISVSYAYKNGIINGNDVNLPTGATSDGTITTTIPYNDFGPFAATYIITAIGNGGEESKQILVPINVDETPANFLIPESEDLLKSQNPIYTPDSLVTSYEIVIDDIDIPVEVKADKPILIDINGQEIWNSIREI